ncbi:MAG: phosphate ABC transporter permease subunit PstC, partial [Deinococcus sp.]|nr:phosphate ABC transporter permease subunit PstC [Deinococcus sp.]
MARSTPFPARLEAGAPQLRTRRARSFKERAIQLLLLGCGLLSILTTLSIILVFLFETIGFFRQVSIFEFFGSTRWTPLFLEKHYGVWPLVIGTLVVTLIAVLVALPLGLLSAVYLSEFASPLPRRILKPSLEILAGIPTVVYGYFALLFVTPLLRHLFPGMDYFNGLSAGIVMGFMILPMVSSISEDAIYAVPQSLRQAAYAMGATKFEVATKVVVPAALSGIMAAFILAISRAVGETMIVAIAAGQTPNFTLNPLRTMETMTAYVVNVATGDAEAGDIVWGSVFTVGATL